MAYLTIGSDGRPCVDERSELGASFLKKLVSKVTRVFGGKAKAPAVEEVAPGAATVAPAGAAASGGTTEQVMKMAPYLLLGIGGIVLVMTLLKRKRR